MNDTIGTIYDSHFQRGLMRAIETYRDYLRKRDCLENAKEEAVQRIIDGVIEEQHEKTMASRKREHDQRRQLFQVCPRLKHVSCI